jgi:hypothetical protein
VIKIEGTEQLERVAEQLAAAGNVELRKRMMVNLRGAVAPVKPLIVAEARGTLPHTGGANEWVASAKIAVGATVSPKTAIVAVRMRQPNAAKSRASKNARAAGKRFKGSTTHDLVAINAGTLRHPTYGNRGPGMWFDTEVKPGFFTRPCTLMAPAIRAACNITIAETAAAAGFTEL